MEALELKDQGVCMAFRYVGLSSCMSSYFCIRMYVACMYVCMYVCRRIHIHICTYVYIYTCVKVHVCISIYYIMLFVCRDLLQRGLGSLE